MDLESTPARESDHRTWAAIVSRETARAAILAAVTPQFTYSPAVRPRWVHSNPAAKIVHKVIHSSIHRSIYRSTHRFHAFKTPHMDWGTVWVSAPDILFSINGSVGSVGKRAFKPCLAH